jgi:phosphoglycerate dehydrogenase-like enzyme
MRDAAGRLKKLEWVQTLAAGPDSVLAAGFAPHVVVTDGRSLHDLTVTEHTLALVLAAARRVNLLVRAQLEHRWAGELGGLQPIAPADSFRTLRGAAVAIWGFGGIAASLAPHLKALGATVTGVARSGGERHGFPVVATAELPELLPHTDVLIMILPSTPETRHALDAASLALLPPHAWVVNVGRGSTVDESALLDALRAQRIGGAALDVFEIEPLPSDSGLWDEPNVIITPHAAGGRPIGGTGMVAENLAALLSGEPLRNVVER